jgi:hypothetical protein
MIVAAPPIVVKDSCHAEVLFVYDARLGTPVYQEVSGLEQRLTDLQAQLDRLTVTLQLWRDQQDRTEPAQGRLAELTREVGDLVSQWNATNERQTRAVGELEERVSAFSHAEQRLHQDAAERLRALERQIEQEWTSLRQLHEAPLRELRDRAETLSQVSIATSNSTVTGLERTEARLAQMEAGLHQHLADMSRQLDAALREIRALTPARSPEPGAGPAWPIEGVVRLHEQLRQSTDAVAPSSVVLDVPAARPALPAMPAELAARLEAVEQAIAQQTAPDAGATEPARTSRSGVGLLAIVAAVVLVVAGVVGWTLRQQAQEAVVRAAEAERRAQAAVAAASERMASLQKEASREVAQAREGAARAQAVSDILAAPDLIRFAIAGTGPSPIGGQVLWSRSRGVVFSGVRLPPVPERMTYQLWLLTDSAPVNAGTFQPDATGRVTFSADAPRVPRPVTGAALTLEPAGGSQVPSDRLLVQNRPPRPAPPVQP